MPCAVSRTWFWPPRQLAAVHGGFISITDDSVKILSDLAELADWYALSGAQIKNAALAGAFLAASSGQVIHQRHFLWAIEREFDKAGRAHPGYPAHHAQHAQPAH